MEGFNIEEDYKEFLESVGLSEVDMIPIQKKQVKQAFMEGANMMYCMLTEGLSEINDDDKGAEVMMHLARQLDNFFLLDNLSEN